MKNKEFTLSGLTIHSINAIKQLNPVRYKGIIDRHWLYCLNTGE